MTKQIYQLTRVNERGEETPMTLSKDEAYIYGEQARMNAQAEDGIVYIVQVVEPVTKPLRVVGDE